MCSTNSRHYGNCGNIGMQSLEHLSRSLIRHLTKCHLVFLQLSLDGAGVAEVENALLEFLLVFIYILFIISHNLRSQTII